MTRPIPSRQRTSPEMFFAKFFRSRAARDGAVIRRKVRDVEWVVGRDIFLREI